MYNRTGNTFQRPTPVSDAERFPPASPTPQFYECSICGAMHFASFDGDCRQDDARFFAEELDERYGDDWEEVDMCEEDDTEEDNEAATGT